MAEGVTPDIPSETAIIELLLRVPPPFPLTEQQTAALRILSYELQAALLDSWSAVCKAELRQQADETLGNAKEAELAIDGALAAGAAARTRANMELRRILTLGQYRQIIAAAPPRGGDVSPATATKDAREQRVVEIETAALVAERVMSWAKLFAWLAAVPAAALIAILTVVGVSKFQDFQSLVASSEAKLKATVADATKDSAQLAQTVADIRQQQTENSKQISNLKQDVTSVKERLAFTEGGGITPEAQKRLQEQFKSFQDYIAGLGYSPGNGTINVTLLADTTSGVIAYYQDNTIFVSKSGADDPEVIYREYLHHVLYSKVGIDNAGIERNALESGVADFMVASYLNRPQIYKRSLGSAVDLDNNAKLRAANSPADAVPVGRLWAALLWQLRQSVGQQLIDKAVLATWFDLDKDIVESAVPAAFTTKLYAQISRSTDGKFAQPVVQIFRNRNAPIPPSP